MTNVGFSPVIPCWGQKICSAGMRWARGSSQLGQALIRLANILLAFLHVIAAFGPSSRMGWPEIIVGVVMPPYNYIASFNVVPIYCKFQ